MECNCYAWAGAPSCYMGILDKLQKQMCRTVTPSLAASLNLALSPKCGQLESITFTQGITLDDVHLNWLNWFCFLILGEVHSFFRLIAWFFRHHSVTILSSFTARLWNFFPVEWFPWTYDLNGFKSRIDRQILFKQLLLFAFNHFLLFPACV